MRSREVQQFLASITGRSLSEIDQRTRGARAALDIPSGPRGVHAPHMDAGEALIHVLCLASRKGGDAFQVAKNLLQGCALVPHPDQPGLSEAFRGDARRLSMFMMMAMGEGLSSVGFHVSHFELSSDGEFAWMRFDRRSLKNLTFLFSASEDHWTASEQRRHEIYRGADQLAAGSRFVIGAAHLRSLGTQISLNSPAQSGEVDDSDEREDDLVVATALEGFIGGRDGD